MIIGIMLLTLAFAIVVMVPLAFAFGIAGGVAGLLWGQRPGFIPHYAFVGMDSFPLLAVPLFLLAGDLMAGGRLADVLVNLFDVVAGRVKGGLGAVNSLACMFFGTLTGSAVATIAAIGSIMIPKMVDHGYDRRYATALTAVTGLLGFFIPPSIPLIIYGLATGTSIGALFLASATPGVILGVVIIIVNHFYHARWYHPPKVAQQPQKLGYLTRMRALTRTFVIATPALLMPVLILGGIYGGVFTPTEAAGVAAAYALLVGLFIYRGLKWRSLYGRFYQTAITSAILLPILGFAIVLTRAMAGQGIPQQIADMISQFSTNVYVVWIFLNIVLLILGMPFDIYGVTVLLAPLLMPTADKLGINLVHLGVVMIMNLGFGNLTPPLAVNVFVAAKVGGVKSEELWRPTTVFLVFACLPVLILTTYVPEVSLWLPRLVLGAKAGF